MTPTAETTGCPVRSAGGASAGAHSAEGLKSTLVRQRLPLLPVRLLVLGALQEEVEGRGRPGRHERQR